LQREYFKFYFNSLLSACKKLVYLKSTIFLIEFCSNSKTAVRLLLAFLPLPNISGLSSKLIVNAIAHLKLLVKKLFLILAHWE